MRIFVNDFSGHPFQMQLSRQFAAMGHVVQHVYFADNVSTPKGMTHMLPGDPEGLSIEGLHIKRKFEKHSLLTRRQADIEYGKEVVARVHQFRPDAILSSNMPLNAQAILMRVARRNNVPFVFWLQDVLSDAARYVIRKKAKALAWLGGAYFERLEKKLLRESNAIVCIAPGFVDLLNQWRVPPSKIHVIENWAPLNEVRPLPKNNAWAVEHGVANKFCLMYSGTLGIKHRPELLLQLAQYLQAHRSGRLIVIAAGLGMEWLREHASAISPDALELLPFQPYERVSEVMASADALITLLDSEAGAFSVPSKTLAYLCAGRTLLMAAPPTNQAARVVQRARAGIVVSPDDPRELVAAAERLIQNQADCAEFGRNARSYAEQAFAIDEIAVKFLRILGCPDVDPAPSDVNLQIAQ